MVRIVNKPILERDAQQRPELHVRPFGIGEVARHAEKVVQRVDDGSRRPGPGGEDGDRIVDGLGCTKCSRRADDSVFAQIWNWKRFHPALGRRLGFEKVAYYAHQYGLGELAGYDITGEQLGAYPEEVIPEKLGGVGKMCSFGEGVSMTPLQLGAMVSAIANGGTLYYLQHPTTPEEVANFQPRVKRQLDIAPVIPELSDGMAGAVQYGTARSLRLNFNEEEILGKTGTCSHEGTRYGWFASYANTEIGRVVVVIFLEGGRPTFGPKAAEIAGRMYRNMYDHNFFVAGHGSPTDSATVKTVSTTP